MNGLQAMALTGGWRLRLVVELIGDGTVLASESCCRSGCTHSTNALLYLIEQVKVHMDRSMNFIGFPGAAVSFFLKYHLLAVIEESGV